MTCLHATEPASVYLSAFARVEASRADIDKALYEERSVVKQLAMRRTLFAFPRDLLPAVWGSASARVLDQLRTRLAKEVESNGLADGRSRLAGGHVRGGAPQPARRRSFHDGRAARAHPGPGPAAGAGTGQGLRRQLPDRPPAAGHARRRWADRARGEQRRLARLAAAWSLTEDWLGEPVRHAEPDAGYRVLVERWLRTFGPGTEADLVWWLGATKGAVRRALGDLGAVEVGLGDGVGYLLPDDLDDVPEPEPWAALLPVLDPTTMGWKQRGFYLADEDVPHLFDSNGNAGTTAWWEGRIVGCWVQDDDGVVSVVLRHDIGADGDPRADAEASRLTDWLAGHRVGTVYPSALMRSALSPEPDPPG